MKKSAKKLKHIARGKKNKAGLGAVSGSWTAHAEYCAEGGTRSEVFGG